MDTSRDLVCPSFDDDDDDEFLAINIPLSSVCVCVLVQVVLNDRSVAAAVAEMTVTAVRVKGDRTSARRARIYAKRYYIVIIYIRSSVI